MKQEVMKEINRLHAEKALCKVALINAKNEEDAEEVEAINKEIASLDNEISKLSPQLMGNNS